MSVPPAPPRKNKHLAAASGGGHNAAARLRSSPALLEHDHPSPPEQIVEPPITELLSPRSLLDEMPETIIGENVVVKGELKFDRLLRINGICTGKLISQGNLVIGSTGKVVGNIDNMGSVLVDGRVEGNINVEIVSLRNRAQVFGNITCKSITIDPEVVIAGKLNINPKAPLVIDSNGNEVVEVSGSSDKTETKEEENVSQEISHGKQEEDAALALQKKLEAEAKEKHDDEEAILAALEKQKIADQEASRAALLGDQAAEEEMKRKQEEEEKAAVEVAAAQKKQEEEEKAAAEEAAAAQKKKEEEAAAKALSDETEARARQKKLEDEAEAEAARKKQEEEEKAAEEEKNAGDVDVVED